MPEVADLVAKLRGEDSLSGMLAGVETRFKSLGASSEASMAKLTTVGVAIGALTAGVIGYSVKAAAGYQELITALHTGAGESEANLGMVSQAMLNMASQVGVSADELARGMYMVESAGYHGAAGLQVLRASAQGARIGLADQATVADALTTVLKDYHESASDAAGVTGQLIATVAAGKTHLDDLAGSLGKLLPYASGLHISFQQMGAAMAVMTAHGVDAARASTAIQSGLMQLINPSQQGRLAIMELGVNLRDLQTRLASGDMTGALTMFQTAVEKATRSGRSQAQVIRELTQAFGGIRGGLLASVLIPNMGEYQQDLSKIGTPMQGARKEAESWALTQRDLNSQLARLGAGLNAAAISLGTTFLPIITEFVTRDLNPALQGIESWVQKNPQWVKGIAAVGLAIGGLALTEKLVTPLARAGSLLATLAGFGKAGGAAKDLERALSATKVATMIVTADIVNVNGGLGGGGESAATSAAKAAGIGAAGTVALTAGAAAALAGFMVSGVNPQNQVTPERNWLNRQIGAYDQNTHDGWARLSAAQRQQYETAWEQQYAATTGRGLSPAVTGLPPVTVNVQSGAVTVQGGDTSAQQHAANVRQVITDALADYSSQLVAAQKKLNKPPSTRLPGQIGGRR